MTHRACADTSPASSANARVSHTVRVRGGELLQTLRERGGAAAAGGERSVEADGDERERLALHRGDELVGAGHGADQPSGWIGPAGVLWAGLSPELVVPSPGGRPLDSTALHGESTVFTYLERGVD